MLSQKALQPTGLIGPGEKILQTPRLLGASRDFPQSSSLDFLTGWFVPFLVVLCLQLLKKAILAVRVASHPEFFAFQAFACLD